MIELFNDQRKLESTYDQVFRSKNPLSNVSHDRFPIRVLYSCESLDHNRTLSKKELYAVNAANNTLYDEPYFLSNLEEGGEIFSNRGFPNKFSSFSNAICKDVSEEDITNFGRFSFNLNHAYYSSIAKWGIIISWQYYGVLVCEDSFWEIYEKESGYTQQVYFDFLRYFGEEGLDRKWVLDFMNQFTNLPKDFKFHSQLHNLADQESRKE